MTAIAIVGQGGMGHAHARAWNEVGLGESIRYICTPGAPRRMEDAPHARFVTDLDTVLADPAVDLVSICTPTPTHAELAIRCLEAGMNVLLEKPIALTLADARAIEEAAARSTGVLMVAHVVRFFDGYRAIRQRVMAGELGTVLAVRAERLSAAPGPSSWWHDESRSGGTVVDFAIHDIDQLTLFLGTPSTVLATRVRPDGPVEITVDYLGGGTGRVLSFMGMPAEFPFASSLEVLGSLGLADHRFVGGPTGASLGVVPPENDSYRLVVDGSQTHRIATSNPYARQAQYFLDCVRDGTEPDFCPIGDAVLALTVALAARESLARGGPVSLHS